LIWDKRWNIYGAKDGAVLFLWISGEQVEMVSTMTYYLSFPPPLSFPLPPVISAEAEIHFCRPKIPLAISSQSHILPAWITTSLNDNSAKDYKDERDRPTGPRRICRTP